MKLTKKQKWIVGVLTGIILISLSALAYGVYEYNQFFSRIYEPIDNDHDRDSDLLPIGSGEAIGNGNEKENKMKPFTLMILGVDSRGEKKSRSDTIILSVVNPQTKKVTLISIPRDTRVEVPNHGYEKMNHTMFLGGVPMVDETLESFFGIPVQRYVTVDFEGFRRIVDELGGIEIDVKKRMRYRDPTDGTDINLKPGLQTLNGEDALDYARYRKSDIGRDDTDFERIARQQEVIRAIAAKAKEEVSIFNIFTFMDIVGDHVKTDLTKKEIEMLVKEFQGVSGDIIESINLAGEDKYLPYGEYKLYFYVVSDEERERVKGLLEQAMETPQAVTP
jgi:LCP family protein required for cell wall assembly